MLIFVHILVKNDIKQSSLNDSFVVQLAELGTEEIRNFKFLNFERRKITILGIFLLKIIKCDTNLMVLEKIFKSRALKTLVQILKSSAENP